MSVTREQVLEKISGFGVPLPNIFLIGKDIDTLGGIVVWYPEIGLREVIVEKDDLAAAIYQFLREAGVRRFKGWDELKEAEKKEQWEGWDTCADYRRQQQAMEELGKRVCLDSGTGKRGHG